MYYLKEKDDLRITNKKEKVAITPSEYDKESTHSYKKQNDFVRGINTLSMNAQRMYSYILFNLRNEITKMGVVDFSAKTVPSVDLHFSITDFCRTFHISPGGTSYSVFRDAIMELGRLHVVFDNGKSRFARITLFPVAMYEDGEFFISVEGMLVKVLADASKNFTLLTLEELKQFKNGYIWRLYELLKSFAYASKWETDTGVYRVQFLVSELRFLLGTSELCESTLKKMEKNNISLDYDAEFQLSVQANKSKYAEWRRFKEKLLDPACEEITKKTQFSLSYEVAERGQAGAIRKITFLFERKEYEASGESIERNENLIPLLEDFKEKTIREFLVLAGGNEQTVWNKYQLLKANSGVRNKVAWMKSAIKEDYRGELNKDEDKQGQSGDFSKFHQREYDYDQLELMLLTTQPG